jgi:hypothetical protein
MLCGLLRTDIYSYVFNCVEPSIQESALKINPQQSAALLLSERADCPWPQIYSATYVVLKIFVKAFSSILRKFAGPLIHAKSIT